MPDHFYPFPDTEDETSSLLLRAAEGIAKDLKIQSYVGCRIGDDGAGNRGLKISASSIHADNFGKFQRRLPQELGQPFRLWGCHYGLSGLQDTPNPEDWALETSNFLHDTHSLKAGSDFKIGDTAIFFMRRSHRETFSDSVRLGTIRLPPQRMSDCDVTARVVSLDAFRLRK